MLIGFDASRAFGAQNTGTENYSLNLLKALAKVDRKNHYRVYLRGIENPEFRIENLRKEYPKNFEFRVVKPHLLWTQIGLALETWRAPVDVLFVPAHTLPILRKRKFGIYNFKFTISNSPKCIVTIHDLGVEYLPQYHQFPQKYYIDLASRYAAKSADCLIAVSQATKHDLERIYGIDAAKIKVIYEGVDKDFFKPQSKSKIDKVKKKYKISGDYFLYVGTVQPRKNLMFLIDMFNTFVKCNSVKSNSTKYNKTDRKFSLIIAGKLGWDYNQIIQKGTGNVKFLGYVNREDLSALYSGAISAVFPSLFEGFGLPILEALSSGCRVIASDIPVHRELFGALTRGYESIKRSESGRKSGNPNHPEAMMLAKLNDERQWLGLLHQYSRYVYKRESISPKSLITPNSFSWEKVAKDTLEVFNEVVSSKK